MHVQPTSYRFLLGLFFCLPLTITAQWSDFFFRQGNNLSQVNCSGVLFAPLTNQYHQAFGAGSVLVRKPISLLADFSVSFVLDFKDTTGVDGGAFILQSDPSLLGETYNGLGVKGVDHSVAITFDAKQNPAHNDPPFDHVSIQTNGVIDHNTANNLAGPITIEQLYTKTVYLPYGDLEKSFVHIVTINWKAGSKILSVGVDGTELITATADLVPTVFQGNPTVYWGFVASNTQATWYPASKELLFGYMRFSFGDIFPHIKTLPEMDTCFGPPVQVFDSSVYGEFRGLSGLTNAQWFWDFGDGTTSTHRYPPSHDYPKAGVYNIRFAVTNAFGCTFDTVVQKIALGALPVADFSYTAGCSNAPIRFMDKSLAVDGGIFHWEWDFAGRGSSTEQNPVFQFADTGAKTIRLNVRSNLGCEADTVKTVRVDERPMLSATSVADCWGNVQYTVSLQNSVAVKSWQWRFGDGQTSVEQNPQHHFARNDTYTSLLSATSESGCLSDTISQAVVVEVVKVFAGNDTLALKGQPLQLAGVGNGSFRWSPAVGLSSPSVSSPVATLTADQTYVLTVTNSQGCTTSDTLRIKVFDRAAIFVPSAFTPNGDGKNDVLHLVAPGFQQLLYFRIYNRWGQLLFETSSGSQGWNGRWHNQLSPPAVYIWIAAGIGTDGHRYEKKGTVLLMR